MPALVGAEMLIVLGQDLECHTVTAYGTLYRHAGTTQTLMWAPGETVA
jgi:hypothetical protein